MSIGIEDSIKKYLENPEVSTRLLVVIEFDESTVYRFIVDDSIEEIEICGHTYQSANITRSDREENSDMSIESITLSLSNKWQEWAAIMANKGHAFLNKKCYLYEWFPDFPDEEPILMYAGVIDSPSMTPSDFEIKVVRSLGDYAQESPNMTFDPNCQFSFKDERCRYSGTEFATCGKTLTECIERGNTERFGGHCSVPRELVIKSS